MRAPRKLFLKYNWVFFKKQSVLTLEHNEEKSCSYKPLTSYL